jgi:hypothetical protein
MHHYSRKTVYALVFAGWWSQRSSPIFKIMDKIITQRIEIMQYCAAPSDITLRLSVVLQQRKLIIIL